MVPPKRSKKLIIKNPSKNLFYAQSKYKKEIMQFYHDSMIYSLYNDQTIKCQDSYYCSIKCQENSEKFLNLFLEEKDLELPVEKGA